MSRKNIKTFVNKIYSKGPERIMKPIKKYNHIDELWSTDIMDMSEYGDSNKKSCRYILLAIDTFSKFLCCNPLKNKCGKTKTDQYSKIITNSKRKPDKLESDRGKEFYNSTFQNLLKLNNIHHYSRYTDKGRSFAERIFRTIRNLIKKPVFEKRNAGWLSEITSIITKYSNTYQNLIKMTPNQASKKENEKNVLFNLQNRRQKRKPKFQVHDLFRTADLKKTCSKSDLTSWS